MLVSTAVRPHPIGKSLPLVGGHLILHLKTQTQNFCRSPHPLMVSLIDDLHEFFRRGRVTIVQYMQLTVVRVFLFTARFQFCDNLTREFLDLLSLLRIFHGLVNQARQLLLPLPIPVSFVIHHPMVMGRGAPSDGKEQCPCHPDSFHADLLSYHTSLPLGPLSVGIVFPYHRWCDEPLRSIPAGYPSVAPRGIPVSFGNLLRPTQIGPSLRKRRESDPCVDHRSACTAENTAVQHCLRPRFEMGPIPPRVRNLWVEQKTSRDHHRPGQRPNLHHSSPRIRPLLEVLSVLKSLVPVRYPPAP